MLALCLEPQAGCRANGAILRRAVGTRRAALRVMKFLWVALGALVVSWSPKVWACSCRSAFSVVHVNDRNPLYEPRDDGRLEKALIDPHLPFVVRMSSNYELPEVYRGETLLSYDYEHLPSDGMCAPDLVAISVHETLALGEVLTVVSPDIRERAAEYQASGAEEPEWMLPLRVHVGAEKIERPTNLRVDVTWVEYEPEEFSGAFCAANVLLPYQSLGFVRVEILSDDEVEFYATVSVELPGGENYRETSTSRWIADYSAEVRLPGSRLITSLPLTNVGDRSECFQLTVFDHRFDPVFAEEVCPADTTDPVVMTSLSFDALLAELPEFPEEKADGSRSGGCSMALGASPLQSPAWPIGPLAVLGLAIARRRRGLAKPPTD